MSTAPQTPRSTPVPDRGVAANHKSPVPRHAYRWPTEFAAAIGMSDDWVRRQGLSAELRMVRRGTVRLVPAAEVDRWLAENARLVLEDDE
jgi:hypothetical protein